jgi:hypothetical protein
VIVSAARAASGTDFRKSAANRTAFDLTGPVKESPRSCSRHVSELGDPSRFRIPVSDLRCNSRVMDGLDAGRVGRPSKLAHHAPQIAQWLREEPPPSAVEILRRVRLAGYRGGKSALYELVRRVKTRPLEPPAGVQQLIVVARNHQHLYKFFQRAFVGNETVRISLDRRVTERRKLAQPRERERRRAARRSPAATEGLIRVIGWTIVRLDAAQGRRSAPQ